MYFANTCVEDEPWVKYQIWTFFKPTNHSQEGCIHLVCMCHWSFKMTTQNKLVFSKNETGENSWCNNSIDFNALTLPRLTGPGFPQTIMTWWRHQMETFSALLAICAGNSPVRTKASDAELSCFSLICAWIFRWVNTRETGDLRRYRSQYDVIVMQIAQVFHS